MNQSRIQSVDILRGAVMVIMALDHVRAFSGMPPGDFAVVPFLSRWITHFCAPAFTFFAGTSAYLYYQKYGSRKELVNFLITRGLFLAFLEMVVVRFLWTFNFDISFFVHTNIIWALGWSMVILAMFVRLTPKTIGFIGLALVCFQQVFRYVPDLLPTSLQESFAQVWSFFYPTALQTKSTVGGFALPTVFGITILYVIIPWLGVMMAGYGFGQMLSMEKEKLKKYCLYVGQGMAVMFVVGGSLWIWFGSPNPSAPFLLTLLNQQKYPPSQFYLLMTLGPVIALVPWAEQIKGKAADILKIVGRVPMFYYLLHLLTIHLSALIVNLIISGNTHNEWYITSPLVMMPEEFRWALWLRYAVWALNLIPLFFICRWYAAYKARNPDKKWLKYL